MSVSAVLSQSVEDTAVMLIFAGPLPLNLLRNLQEAAHLLAGSGSLTGIPVQKTKDKPVGPNLQTFTK